MRRESIFAMLSLAHNRKQTQSVDQRLQGILNIELETLRLVGYIFIASHLFASIFSLKFPFIT